ncbi:MAG TPA: hypothetical protein VNT75_07920 [Symbiobacteriaceae bacterium]|nr:hypothetical protein [Symbiobacteriaceae bacterium]
MRPWRSGWTNVAVYAAAYLAGGLLPWWLALLLAVGVVKLDKWYYYSKQAAADELPVEDADLVSTVQDLGAGDLQVVAVKGNGGPYINLRGNRLLVARKALDVLTEEELRAAILHRKVTPPNQAWRLEVEPHLPWGAVTLAVAVVAEFYKPAMIVLLPCLMLWAWSVGARRPYCPWLTREHFQAFLDRGGSGPALISALAKINWHIAGDLPQGSIQNRMAGRVWANLELMASMCGMSKDELTALADRHGVGELYLSARMPVWHRMGFARTIFVLAGVYVLIPVLLLGTYFAGDVISRALNG